MVGKEFKVAVITMHTRNVTPGEVLQEEFT
jgi:hypothetical protein